MAIQKVKSLTKPALPTDKEEFTPQRKKLNVEVSYGSNVDKFDVVEGQTFGQVLSDVSIKAAIGYGNVADNLMLIANGNIVSADYVVKDNDVLELIRPAGEKA